MAAKVTELYAAVPTRAEAPVKAQHLGCPELAPVCTWMWLREIVWCCELMCGGVRNKRNASTSRQMYLAIIHDFTAARLSLLTSIHGWSSERNAERVLDLTSSTSLAFFLLFFLASVFL